MKTVLSHFFFCNGLSCIITALYVILFQKFIYYRLEDDFFKLIINSNLEDKEIMEMLCDLRPMLFIILSILPICLFIIGFIQLYFTKNILRQYY
jgi:hypothetical protein